MILIGNAADASADTVLGRRTQRTRRAKPHFFDSLEYGTHVRRVIYTAFRKFSLSDEYLSETALPAKSEDSDGIS